MNREPRTPGSFASRLVTGLIVVAIGLAFLGDNLGLLNVEDFFRLWPFALVAIGAAKLLQRCSAGCRLFGAVLVFIGGLGIADEYFHVSVDVWRWWPLAIVAFGIMILMRGLRPGGDELGVRVAPPAGIGQARSGPAFGASGSQTSNESTASEFAVWSGVKRRVTSASFRSATLTAVMGGIEFDLRPASTATGEAVVEVFAMWGGIEITVPPDWRVTTKVVPLLGGVEDRTSGAQDARHHLIVKGTAIMGGVEVHT